MNPTQQDLRFKIQHKTRVFIAIIRQLLQKKWFKISLILGTMALVSLIVVIINFRKEEKPLSKKERTLPNRPIPKSDLSIFDFTYYLISEAQAHQDDNRVNDFSTIGFVMNPNYAKEHNIDPKIVAEKRRIVDNYIKIFAPIAVTEMKKFKIPASITLAQGLLESDAGGSRLARNNNNHFGIKCFSTTCKKGHCVNYTDDSHKDFFRNFDNPWGSYREHSLFLLRPRYSDLQKLKPTDYKGWAKGLQTAGYATDKAYSQKLIRLIEYLKLNKYDK